ncbi:MAG: tRNA (adenosine(37)-N6)-threonylcarbamoyltransferase complex transferase subunit TsaD [Myxococcota bacterium]|nr:tRNA (adenosine(37)-N6)-threonylcarbamoyltransferase complex transferase subunit TsaD [Myxococcota bacterium]MDW8362729.1 tRNA (adenosine(37)-N6)-threonylcarbamoyltransferase complex transferase subunit TsaD [Myxococcales bacterium]
MRVLGIETSCDETAAAVVDETGLVHADVVSSQVARHAPHGGIVPELAARMHLTAIVPVVERALEQAGGWARIDALAVTQGPGLVGALLVGLGAARAMALARDLPLVGVNHLEGHLLAPRLRWTESDPPGPAFPYVALLVSGGHSALYEVRDAHDVEILGQTRDDAAGEVFDKVARLLGLGYPGGPRIDALASRGRADAIRWPRPMADRGDSLDMSFSGLKTAVALHVRRNGVPDDEQGLADLCASFQRVMVDALVERAIDACLRRGASRLVLTGGVAANRGLRAAAAQASAAHGIELFVPPVRACTDNAAMIALAATHRLARGERADQSLAPYARDPVAHVRGKMPKLRRN